MASIKISELDNVTTLVDSDALPIVNGNETKKVTISKLGDILATKNYVNEIIGDIGSTGFTPIIVETLPTSNISTSTIYLVLNEQQGNENIYDEYIYINNKWEIVGSTAVDLSNYYTKNEVDDMISNGSGTAPTVREYQGATPIYKVGIEMKDSGSDSYYLSTAQTTLVQTAVQEAYDNGDLFFILSLCNTYADNPVRKIDVYLWRSETATSFTLENGYNNMTYVKATEFRLPYVYNFTNKIADGVVTVSRVGISQMLWGDNIQPAIVSSGHSGIKQNVLGMSNTTEFTPTADYHPATKKYVDDTIANIDIPEGGGSTIQYKVMPNSETIGDGTIVQYVGETNQDYTNGFWYKWVNGIQVENQLNKVTVIDGTKVSTGIIPSNHRVEMCFEWLEYENDSHAIGTADFNGVNGALHFTIYNNKYYWGYGNNENNFGTFQPGIHTVVFNADENYSLTLNGEIKGAAKATSPTEITLFNRGSSANFNGNFYYLKIWDYDTNELLMYLVPYLNASGNPAIYDVVGQREMTHTGPGFTAGELLDTNTPATWEQINVQKELVAGNNIEIKDGVISAIGNSIPFITISDGFLNNGEYDVISDLMTKWYKENNRLDNFTFINKSTYGSSNISIWTHMWGTGTGSNTIHMQKITFNSPPSPTNNDLKNYYVSFSEWSFRFTINADATVTYQGKTHVRTHGTVRDLGNYDGYDTTKTQILKNINGTIKWEEEVNVTEVLEAEY